MNQPNPSDSYTLPPHVPKVQFTKDNMVENAGTFVIEREDHTLGNLLRMQLLLKERNILFAGYRVPHPTSNHIELRIQTCAPGNGEPAKTPTQALIEACDNLEADISRLEDTINTELTKLANSSSN